MIKSSLEKKYTGAHFPSGPKYNRKFTDIEIREIRSSSKSGNQEAKERGVSKSTIANIRKRKSYPEVI